MYGKDGESHAACTPTRNMMGRPEGSPKPGETGDPMQPDNVGNRPILAICQRGVGHRIWHLRPAKGGSGTSDLGSETCQSRKLEHCALHRTLYLVLTKPN